MSKATTYLLLIAVSVVAFATCIATVRLARADSSIYSQTDDSALNSSYVGAQYQVLGSGLTGVLKEVSIEIQNQSAPSSFTPLQAEIRLSPFGSVVARSDCVDLNGSGTGKTQLFFDFSNQFTFDPSQSYELLIANDTCSSGASVNRKYYGSASNTWSGGSFQNSGGGVSDMFFVLNGVQTVTDVSRTTITSPLNGSTTASTLINLSFNYHAAAVNSISSYSIVVHDISVNQDFNLSGSASTGDSSISRSVTLTSGHSYTYVAYVCNNAGTCYGGPSVSFSVVTNSLNYGFSPVFNGFATSSGQPTSIDFSRTSDITEANGSSTLEQAAGGFSNFLGYFADRVPVGYLWSIRDIYVGVASSSSVYSGVGYDFSDPRISTSTRSYLPHSFQILSTTTVTAYLSPTLLGGLNTVADAAIAISALLVLWNRGRSVVSSVSAV